MSQARQPRASLIVQGSTIPIIDLRVSQSKDHKCDTASATTALEALPAGMDANWWSTANDIAVQVMIQGDGAAGGTKVFDGKVDHITIDFAERTLKVQGRDKAAKLLDKKVTKKHINRKPHEVAQDLASDGGISLDADQVSDKAGKLVQIDFASIVHRMSIWDAIQVVADKHDMIAYATGGKAYFKKPDEQLPTFAVVYTPPTGEAYATGNFVKLSVERNCVLGRPVKCHVHSWNHKDKKLFEATEEEPGVGDPLEYHLHPSNLSQDQAQKRAKAHKDKVTKHEFDVTVDMPGDETMNARHMLQLSGTGTAFDQQYEVQSVEHRISVSEGYRMTISSKAKSKKRGKS